MTFGCSVHWIHVRVHSRSKSETCLAIDTTTMTILKQQWRLGWCLVWAGACNAFVSSPKNPSCSILCANPEAKDEIPEGHVLKGRRSILNNLGTWAISSTAASILLPHSACWADFAPGGTLVDYAVGVQVGNAQASPSRKADNSNVLFAQDYYFKFGTAAPWVEPDSTEFPKTMPFVRVQQRYDALKKYGDRIQGGLNRIAALEKADRADIADPVTTDVYQLRPMGLLANNLLASENTGSTNELFLARWYINEMYLLINDLRNAPTDNKAVYEALKAATNSYLSLMNRVITPKVGDKFSYL